MSLRVYGRETSARPSNADFQMVAVCDKLRKQRRFANGRRFDEREKVRRARETREQNRRRRNTKTSGYIWRGEGRAARRGLETRQRWPEFRRSGKSAGKIHGSLCRAAVWQIVCVYKTHFAGTYLPAARLFLARFHSRQETRAEFVSEK